MTPSPKIISARPESPATVWIVLVGIMLFLAPFVDAEERAEEKVSAAALPDVRKSELEKIPALPKSALMQPTFIQFPNLPKPVSIARPPRNDTYEMQQRLNDLVRLNETLKTQYALQAAHIKRIREEAKRNQSILKQIAIREAPKVQGVPPLSKDQFPGSRSANLPGTSERTES